MTPAHINQNSRSIPTYQHDKVLNGRITKANNNRHDILPSRELSQANLRELSAANLRSPSPSYPSSLTTISSPPVSSPPVPYSFATDSCAATAGSLWTNVDIHKLFMELRNRMRPENFYAQGCWQQISQTLNDPRKTAKACEIKAGDLLASFAEIRTLVMDYNIPWDDQRHILGGSDDYWMGLRVGFQQWWPELLKWQTTKFPEYDLLLAHEFSPIIAEGPANRTNRARHFLVGRYALLGRYVSLAFLGFPLMVPLQIATSASPQPAAQDLDACASALVGQAITKVQEEKWGLTEEGMIFMMDRFTEKPAGIYLSITNDRIRAGWLVSVLRLNHVPGY